MRKDLFRILPTKPEKKKKGVWNLSVARTLKEGTIDMH